MLKGFISGEEKDIKRIPMKGKNLFDVSTVEKGRIDNGEVGYAFQTSSLTIEGGTVSFTTTATYRGVCSGFFEIPETGNLWFNFTTNETLGVKFVFYDSSKTWLNADYIHTLTDPFPAMATIPTDAKYVRISFTGQIMGGSDYTMSDIMLNLGSTALPYEPYGYQNGWEIRDNQNRIIWGREDELETTTGTLMFKGYNLPIKVKSLLGNSVQNGTPSPNNPIIPEFCGVRTGNLFPLDATKLHVGRIENDGTIGYKVGTITVGTNSVTYQADVTWRGFYTDFIQANENEKLTFSPNESSTISLSCNCYDENDSFLGKATAQATVSAKIFTLLAGTKKVRINVTSSLTEYTITNPMLNLGSTALPYEPFGWAEKITCAGQTVPVYLGQTPTVRRVRKLVLTGKEDWMPYTNYSAKNCYKLTVRGMISGAAICTHYKNTTLLRTLIDNDDTHLAASATWIIHDSRFVTIEDIKQFLHDEYANGTPVTIWYVLAEPTTAIVNEPLCKISTYADELTTIKVNGLSVPLYGIGDYKDTLNLSTGVVTRNAKKLVLTGNEKITIDEYLRFSILVNNIKASTSTRTRRSFCSHYECLYHEETYDNDWNNVYYQSGSTLFFHDRRFTSASAFKSFLQQQYQNGTPVTVWYVLNTPETETVTVPTGMTGEVEGYLTQISTPTPEHQSIPKWNGEEETGGTYAVTVYNLPEIPTTTGQNNLTVETEKIHGLTNPLCGIGDYKDVLDLSSGIIKRKIKKLILDGTESWQFYSDSTGDYGAWQFYVNGVVDGLSTLSAWSNIADYGVTSKIRGRYQYGVYLVTNGTGVAFQMAGAKDVFTGINAWKSYLAQQYQNGTPVTIWYILNTPETESITVSYGLECTVEGYLTQSGTPTPSNPITPDANGILESDGTYAVEVSLVPSNLAVKGHIKLI